MFAMNGTPIVSQIRRRFGLFYLFPATVRQLMIKRQAVKYLDRTVNIDRNNADFDRIEQGDLP